MASEVSGLNANNQIDRYQKTLSITHNAASNLQNKFRTNIAYNQDLNNRISNIFENLKTWQNEIHAEHTKPRSILERIFIRRPSLKEKMLFSLKTGIEVALNQIPNPALKQSIKEAIGIPSHKITLKERHKITLKERIFRPLKYGLRSSTDIVLEKFVKNQFRYSKSQITLMEGSLKLRDLDTRIKETKQSFAPTQPLSDFMTDFVRHLLTSEGLRVPYTAKQDEIASILGKVYPELKLGRGKEHREDTINKTRQLFESIDPEILKNKLFDVVSNDRPTISGSKPSLKRELYPLFFQYLESKSQDPTFDALKKQLLDLNASLKLANDKG